MTSRGRGYGARGNYGGGSRGGGYRGNSYRGNRGSYEGRGGRGGYSSYVSNDRYNNDGMDRYQSRNDSYKEESYKKPYRGDTMSSYNSREYVPRGGSPDRKRMRMEGSSGDRRGHDGGYGGSYSSRQEGYGRSFSGERRRSPSREGYRKSSIGMPPPRSPPRSAPRTRSSAPIRRYRGRVMRSRASYRGAPIRSRGYGTRRLTSRSDYFPRPRITKIRSSIKVKPDSGSSTENEDWDAEEKDEVDDEDEEEVKEEAGEVKVKVKVDAKEDDAAEENAGEGSVTDKEGVEDATSEQGDGIKPKTAAGRPYIPLACLHCKEKCITFKSYEKHLLTVKHRTAMGVVAGRRKQQLLRLRANQRNQQRELETRRPASLAARTAYCPLCKLNHRTPRHTHNLSELHRATKRFLFPFCKICRVTCRSPMIYEHHLCSLEHIRRKSRHDARTPSEAKAEDAGSAEEGMDVDLENFMTLDSVGDVDEVDDEESGGEKKEEEEGAEKKPKVEINIGSEHIKKLEVYWCELCNLYLPRSEDEEGAAAALRRHCRMRHHLGRYVRHRDNRTLRKHAERIHRQLQKQIKESEGVGKETKVKIEGADESMDTSVGGEAGGAEQTDASATTLATENGAAGADDKLWADVDKDLGELLREVDQAAKSSDDEEDTGRYDKFRKSDKSGVLGGVEPEPTDAEPATVVDVAAPVTATLNTSA